MKQHSLALRALEAYSIGPSSVTFLRHNENMVFRVADEQTSTAYLLRLHVSLTKALQGERLRPEGIRSELLWLEALTEETSLVLQRPVRNTEGKLVTMIGDEQGSIPCSLLQWIEADPFPMAPSPDQVKRLGTVIARLHAHARAWSVPVAFQRPVYDLAFYRRQILPAFLEGVDAGILSERDFTCMQETLELILATLAEIQEPLLLIHADLWRGNLLASDKAIHLIDFSLCGFGSPLFDLGTCLMSLPAGLRPALINTYQRQERLPAAYPRLLDASALLSRMGAYVYLLADSSEHAWLKERIPRFVAQECRLFAEEKPLLWGGPL